MTDTSHKPIFIQDQQLSRLVLLPEDLGDKLKHLRAQHGGEAWETRAEFEKLKNEQRSNQPRWRTVHDRYELFSQFQSRDRVLLAVTAYAGIGKSMVLHQIDGLLSSVCEGMDVVRVEFSSLPDDWEQYLYTPWKGDEPFLVRILSDEFSKHREFGHELPAIDPNNLRQWIKAKIRTGNFVLAIDSLDEYNAPDATTKAEQLRHLLFEVFPTLHCVVAGRPHAITQELWLSLFSESPESAKNSPRSDWEFMRVEMFDRKQLERFLGKEMADQLKMLEAEIEFSARNLEALRKLDKSTLASIRSTADLYWHAIVTALPEDNGEGKGKRHLHTNLKMDEILHMLSAIGITMALWHDDPRFPVSDNVGSDEFGSNIPVPTADSELLEKQKANPGVMEVGGTNMPPIVEFRRRLFERLLEVYPDWREIEQVSKRRLVEMRFAELIELNAQYVEFGFFKEQNATQVRWRNATLRDFFAALWMTTRANHGERDAFHQRMDVGRDFNYSSIALTWQMICGVPTHAVRLCDGANDSERNLPWLRMIHPLYLPLEHEKRYHARPTQFMFRAWSGLLIRAGFLLRLAWSEYDLLVATTIAQRCFDPKTKFDVLPSELTVRDANAWRITGSFLQEYLALRNGRDEQAQVIAQDIENHWGDCDSRASLQVRVGHAEQKENVEREEVLPHAFSMCAYQVTNRLYGLFDASHWDQFEANHWDKQELARCPAILNWYDSIMVCIWCHGYLPSEWEWEYASRAECKTSDGRNATFYWGDDKERLYEHAWIEDEYAHPVGGLKANEFGLYDTLGNVAEWCRNRYATERRAWGSSSQDDSPSFGVRVLRGGQYDDDAFFACCSRREYGDPSAAITFSGCRVSRVRNP